MSGWDTYSFGDLLKQKVRNGIYKKKEFHGSGCKIVNMGELFSNPRLFNIEMKRVQLNNNEKSKFLLKEGDLIFARRSLTAEGAGKCSIVKEIKEETTFESSIIRAEIYQEKAHPDYLYYFFNGKYGKYLLGTIIRQVAVAGITGSDLMELIIPLPPLPEQKAIAGVLSSLDDKIDLLHRQNKTLESMAEALFRKWFIEEAEDDWELKKLGDYFPIKTGKKDANYSTQDGKYPFFTCSQKSLLAPDYSFEGKAILLAGNGDFNIKRYSGCFEAYQRTYVLMPNSIKYFNFLYILIKYFLSEITSAYQGSVIRFITKGMISDFSFKMPKESIDVKLEVFDKIYERFDYNSSHISILSSIRDTLLPKLISGEVRVKIE